MILTSILKRKQSWIFFDDSTLSSESDVDEDTNMIKASTQTLEKSLFCVLFISFFRFQDES